MTGPGSFLQRVLTLVMGAVFLVVAAGAARAGDRSGDGASAAGIMVEAAWSPVAPPNARVRAVYFALHNHAAEPRALIGVAASGFGKAHLHRSETRNGVASMTMLASLSIPPGGAVSLEPGGLHVMLMAPTEPRAPDAPIALTLEFDDGTQLEVMAETRRHAAGHRPASGGHAHGHGGS